MALPKLACLMHHTAHDGSRAVVAVHIPGAANTGRIRLEAGRRSDLRRGRCRSCMRQLRLKRPPLSFHARCRSIFHCSFLGGRVSRRISMRLICATLARGTWLGLVELVCADGVLGFDAVSARPLPIALDPTSPTWSARAEENPLSA